MRRIFLIRSSQRVAPRPIDPVTVAEVIDDVGFLVRRCDEHINSEFRQFLLGCGCPVAVVRQGGY